MSSAFTPCQALETKGLRQIINSLPGLFLFKTTINVDITAVELKNQMSIYFLS